MPIKVYNSQMSVGNIGKLALPAMQVAKAGNTARLFAESQAPMIRAAANLGNAVGQYFEKRQAKQDELELADATTELHKRAMRFQSNYKQTVFGKDAFGAEDAFGGNVKGEADALVDERFKGRPELAARFRAQSQQLELQAMSAGFAYGDGQMLKYQDETIKGKLDFLADTIGTGSDADITAAQDDYLQTLAKLRPGMNLETEIRNSDMMVAGGRVDRAIAAGNLGAAQKAYKEGYARLGKNAPAYMDKIHRLQKSQEAEARARRTEALAKYAADSTEALFQAQVQSNTAPLRQLGEKMKAMGDKRGDKLIAQAKFLDDNKVDVRFAQDNDLATLGKEIASITAALTPNANGKVVDSEGNELTKEKYDRLAARYDAISGVYNARVKALKDDPAAAADASAGISQEVPASVRVAARLDYQKTNGVPQASMKPLTKSEETTLVSQFQQTKQPAQFIAGVMEMYGNQAQSVMKQLVDSGKLPANFNLIKDMAPGDGNLLATTSGKNWLKDTEDTMPAEFKKKEFSDAVRTELSPIMSTLFTDNESGTAKMIQDSTYRMALAYKQQGMDDATAIKKAAGAVISDRYTVKGSMRIPKRFDADRVEQGASETINDIRVDMLQPIAGLEDKGLSAEGKARATRNMLRAKGKWVVLPDESGVVLTVGNRAVKDRDGKPITRSFEALEEYNGYYSSGSEVDDSISDSL